MLTIYPIALTALVLADPSAANLEPTISFRAGETYEVTRTKDSVSEGSDGSSGSSHDQDTLVEQVLAVGPDGMEVLFDLPASATDDDRRGNWQFPARIFKPIGGPAKLLNAVELEGRVDDWLKLSEMTREECGKWIFTWNAFRIECDPQSVVPTVQAFDPNLPELREGALYRDDHALGPVPLTKARGTSGGSNFTATLSIDPKTVQKDRAEADVVVGEIVGKPVTFEVALSERAKETISGSITITIEVDASGKWSRIAKVTRAKTEEPGGDVKDETQTEILQRRLISSPKL